MKLAVIDSDVFQTEVKKYATFLFPQGNKQIWIDGKRDPNSGQWFYDKLKTPAYTGIDWLTSADTAKTLDCMLLTSSAAAAPFKIDGIKCNTKYWAMCEFIY
jgi:hypothetical protein